MMNTIEVEIRSFITKERYDDLLHFFLVQGEKMLEDEQETHYFDTKEDVRIQKNKYSAKIWMKKGKMHDEQREEIEIKIDKEDFEKMEKILFSLGHAVSIKWFRTRHTFLWQNITVTLDFTKGYGYIIELEKISSQDEKDTALTILKEKLNELHIPLTPREEFDKKFLWYKEHWKEVV